MKKTIAVLLCICMMSFLLPVFSTAAETPLTFTVLADPHFQCEGDLAPMGTADDDIPFADGMVNRETFFYSTVQGQMNYESEAILRAMLKDFAASDSQYLLIAGDLTCGKRQSHKEMAEILKEVENTTGKQIFVINGNHDCDDEDFENYISMEEFREIYADFGYNEALTKHETSASYTVDLNDEYRLIAIDSCIYGKDDGELNDDVFDWVKVQTAVAKNDGKKLVAMMHHSILPHFELQPIMDDYGTFAEFFADNGIQLVFTGHIHANDISSAVSERGNTIYDVQTGALIVAPNAYRTVTLSGNTADIVSEYVTEIDTSYLPEGYTEAQLNAISTDFTTYAYDYFEAGICKWINRYIGSAYKVSRLLKIEQGTSEYEALDSAMKEIGAVLSLDIYDNGENESLEAIAAKSGSTIPASDYEKPYQVAAKIMYGFYHGDEETVSTQADFDLLLACLKASVTQVIYNGSDGAVGVIATAALGTDAGEEILNSAAGMAYADITATIFAKSLLETITGGLKDDCCDPEDINVTLDLSATSEKTAELSLFDKIVAMLTEFIERFLKLFAA